MTAQTIVHDAVAGIHPALGEFQIPMRMIKEFQIGKASEEANETPFSDWVFRAAKEPQFADNSHGSKTGPRVRGRTRP